MIKPWPFYPMPDNYACYPTAIAYAVTELGNPHTPQQLDAVMGRTPGEPSDYIAGTKAELFLLENGYSLEFINEKESDDGVEAEPYLSPESTATYDDFIQEVTTKMGPDAAEYWTADQYEYHRRHYAALKPQVDAYKASGLYVTRFVPEITTDTLHDLFAADRKTVVLADVKSRQQHISHAVAITACTASEVQYFYPADDGGEIAQPTPSYFIDKRLQKRAGLMAVRAA